MRNLKTKFTLLLVLLLIICTNNNVAQNTSNESPIIINTLLLNIPVIVSDKNGQRIAGLTKEDFTITQNEEELPIEFFANEEAPINVAIVVDTSGSVAPGLGNIKDAARTFLKVLRPEDRAMVVSFDGQFKILSELTPDEKTLKRAIGELTLIQMKGSTMYDAIDEVISNKFAAVKGRKVIILLTDGFESSYGISKQKFFRILSGSDTVIYPILFWSKAMPRNDFANRAFDDLQVIADTTAGKIYSGGSDLRKVFQSIADEMRRQYLIGFYSEEGNSNNIKIEIDRKDVVLRTKKKPVNSLSVFKNR